MKKWITDENGKKLYTVDADKPSPKVESNVVDSGVVELQPVPKPEDDTAE